MQALGVACAVLPAIVPAEAARIRPATEVPLPPPRPSIPGEGPAAPAAAPVRLPPAASTCLAVLTRAGIVAAPAEPEGIADPRCAVREPVRLTALTIRGERVDLPDRPLVSCATAMVFGDFVRLYLTPLTRITYGSSVRAVGTGPGFECRPRNRVAGAKLSAHGQGLAIDIAALRLSGRRTVEVGVFQGERDRRFDKAVRAGICAYFHTSLGPGSDAAHARHWHMDLEPRGRDRRTRFCR